MFSGLAFFFSIVHWAVIAGAYFMRWGKVFGLVFMYPSPVLLFFTLLNSIGVNWSGEVAQFFIFSALFNGVKYFILVRAVLYEGLNFCSVMAIIGEVVYLATSSAYLVYYSYPIG